MYNAHINIAAQMQPVVLPGEAHSPISISVMGTTYKDFRY